MTSGKHGAHRIKEQLSPLITKFKCLANHVKKRGSWKGVEAPNSTLNHQPHLTSPNLPLALSSGDYNSHAGKGEGLVLRSQIILPTMQHHRVLQVDSEYSPRLFQNDVGKARSSPQQRTALPLDNRIQMLGKSCQEKGELEGVASGETNLIALHLFVIFWL